MGSPILYLVHRLPFPPDKGDKIRSYHLLEYLAGKFDVYLGCFADDPRDMQYVDALKDMCREVFVQPLNTRLGRFLSLRGLATGEALSIPYYRDRSMQNWVDETLARQSINSCVAFSSPMAQYLLGERFGSLRRVMDFVDIDSDKWKQYAAQKKGPVAWLYAREARKLETFERQVAAEFDASVFVSANETSMFSEIAPETSDRHFAIANGVDTAFFDPGQDFEPPYPQDSEIIAFTGMMDYWPNVDAVTWFAKDVFPTVRAARPNAEFWIVGGSPTAEVSALGREKGVYVTGRVEDIRPYIRFADVVVAPLRIARGVQNKVLEALAMGKTVVCSPEAAAGLSDDSPVPLSIAESQAGFVASVLDALEQRESAVSSECRKYVLDNYDWGRNLSRFGELLSARPAAVEATP